jgi:integrase
MRGHIREKGKGSWQIQVYAGAGPDGKYRRHFETIHGRKSDAQKRLNELLVSVEKGVYNPTGRLTVAEHLHNWLRGYVTTNCSLRTLDSYQGIVDGHLIPAIGQIQLKQLNPQTIQNYYSRECKNVSARSVHHYHRVLSQSLKYAVRQGYLSHNPAELVDPPTPRKKKMTTMTASEVGVLLETAKDSYFYPVIYTALSSGLRQAELLGLRWRDIDHDLMLSISVSQVLYKRKGVCLFKEPKTSHSRRQVRMTPKLAIFLREYHLSRMLLFRGFGKELALDDLVFASVEGKPVDPGSLSHTFHKIVKKAGLENIRFHDCRHTFASLMLSRGANPKVIQEALGHSSVALTLDVYSHIIEGMQSEAMSLLDEIMPLGVSQKINAKLTPTHDIMTSRNYNLALCQRSSVGRAAVS